MSEHKQDREREMESLDRVKTLEINVLVKENRELQAKLARVIEAGEALVNDVGFINDYQRQLKKVAAWRNAVSE